MHLNRNGVGDLVQQGVWYPIPQNPLNNPNNLPNSTSNAIVTAMTSAKVAGAAKGVGDLVTGQYPIPWNPIVNGGSSLTAPRAMMCDTSNALASSVASMTAGPTSQLSGFELQQTANMLGMGGMGQDFATITNDITAWGSDTTMGYPNWIVYGGGLLALWWLFANKKQEGSSRFHSARRTVSSIAGGGKGK